MDLGDARRSRRALGIAERLACSPEASLPEAMGDEVWAEALYRHLGKPAVTLKALLKPHLAKTAERIAAWQDVVYAVSDTTDFQFSGQAARKGLGRVNTHDQGFLCHATLAVAPDRTPLGLLAVETWVRSESKVASTQWARRHQVRESARWGRGMAAARHTVEPHASKLIHVADREGDIYDLLNELSSRGHRFIIRAAQDRRLVPLEADDERSLFDAAQCTPTSFVLDVPLSARARSRLPDRLKAFPARRQRQATLSFAARRVKLRRPKNASAKLPASLEVHIVHVFELGPPPGEAPVEWVLFTTEPIEAQQDVERVVSGYRARWVIEEYFKAIKSGCAYESRQLESGQTLEALLGYTLIVAYAMLLTRSLARARRDEPAEVLFTPTQLLVLRAKQKKLAPQPSVREALLAVAAMGGHLRNNGEPGWRILSKGWSKLLALEEGYSLARRLSRK